MSTKPTPNVDPNSPLGIVEYYSNLLIKQYLGKPKAYATVFSTCAPLIMPETSVQQISFSAIAVSGSFILSYNDNNTTAIQWNDSTSTIQTKVQALPGLASITLTGDVTSQLITVTFTGVTPPAQLLIVISNSLLDGSSNAIDISIAETDQTLPIAVLNAFNLEGSNIAQGVQLDVLGKYCGVVRNGNGPFGPITLNDSDFLVLIKFAIIQNSSGSSLAQIESNLNMFFPGQFIVTDFKNMFMSYLLSSALGSTNLFIMLINQNLIPHPMGVGISVIVPPDVTQFFGFSSYHGLNPSNKPFNTYTNFHFDWFFLSYQDAF